MSKWKIGASCIEISKYNQKEDKKMEGKKYHLQRIFKTKKFETCVNDAPFLLNIEIITKKESHDVPKETWAI
jgi:hypothetical protein